MIRTRKVSSHRKAEIGTALGTIFGTICCALNCWSSNKGQSSDAATTGYTSFGPPTTMGCIKRQGSVRARVAAAAQSPTSDNSSSISPNYSSFIVPNSYEEKVAAKVYLKP